LYCNIKLYAFDKQTVNIQNGILNSII